jgi:LysR family transcriptional regulator, low CO2-responsive transcriptional regulator
MNYTLNQLRIFLKIVQKESITRAAEALFLTQPAVSIQLKNFQDQFDIPLTEIVNKKLYVTDFGREVALAAEKILEEVYAINYKTAQYKGQLSGRLRISVVSTGKYIIPYLLADFMQAHPGVELVLDVSNRANVTLNLERNETDFSLVSVLPDRLNLEEIPCMKNQLYLVGKEPLHVNASNDWRTVLEDVTWVKRETGSATRKALDEYLASHQIQVRRHIELTSNEAVKQALIAGLGYSIMPLIGIRNELTLGQLTVTALPDLPLESMWRVVWPKGKKHNGAALAFKNYLEEQMPQIIEKNFGYIDGLTAVPKSMI